MSDRNGTGQDQAHAAPPVQVCQSIISVRVAHMSDGTVQMQLYTAGPLEQSRPDVAAILRQLAAQLERGLLVARDT